MLLGLLVVLWLQFLLFPKHKSSTIEAVTAPPTQLKDRANLPRLSSYNIFGASTVTEVPLGLLQGESSLNLIITGILASNDAKQGLAYIKNTQGDEKKFKVGDDVFGLAKLEAIHAEHLILSRNGKREKMSLNKGHDLNTRSSRSQTADSKSRVQKNNSSSQRIAQHIKGSDWQAALNQQKYDPNKIAQIAQNIKVVQDANGKVAGLRVSQLTSGSELMRQGLRANDQIVAVNGVEISYQNVLSIQSQLQSSSDVSVTVMRNGRRMNLKLNLSEFQ